MFFVEEKTSELKIYTLQCAQSRLEKPAIHQVLFNFSGITNRLLPKAGIAVEDINQIESEEFRNLVFVTKSGEKYYIVVRVATYPVNPMDISKEGNEAIKELANQFGAVPCICGYFLSRDRKFFRSY